MTSNWKKLKQKCIDQNKEFKELNQKKRYATIHHSHYDWWAFPLDRRSSYGDQYKVFPSDYDILSKDKEFINALRSNAILVCHAWGFDLVKDEYVANPEEDQKWQDWPIRLYKISGSLQLFKQNDLLANSVKYAKRLMAEDHDFTYGPKDLKPYYSKFDQHGIKMMKTGKEYSNHYTNYNKKQQDKFAQKQTEKVLQPPKQETKGQQLKNQQASSQLLSGEIEKLEIDPLSHLQDKENGVGKKIDIAQIET